MVKTFSFIVLLLHFVIVSNQYCGLPDGFLELLKGVVFCVTSELTFCQIWAVVKWLVFSNFSAKRFLTRKTANLVDFAMCCKSENCDFCIFWGYKISGQKWCFDALRV